MSVVVVWKKTNSSNKKYMTVFTQLQNPDQINTNRAKNPVIPNESPFIELGIGDTFIEDYKKKHKIKKHNIWPPKTK